ncbi:MAG: PucR family transcriptional regulator [Pseudomonadota bacterium]
MATVITRHFDSAARARSVERELLAARFSRKIVRVYTQADGLVDALTEAHVDPATAEAYRWRVEGGGAVVLVHAGHKPLGVATTARAVMARMWASDLGNLTEDVFVKDAVRPPSRILTDHPRFLTRDRDPGDTNYHMADWPLPLLSRRKPYTGMLMKPHARMAAWPLSLTIRYKPRDEFAFPRHARMADILFPLTIRRKPLDNFAFPRHARMANWPAPLLSRRKPYTRSRISRHARMANWPFPHLINGQTGRNALVPDGRRMADFPMPLLSDRKPVDKFAFPRHARMANLILPLLSRREPITASIFSGHARMADFLLPLVIRQDPQKPSAGRDGFSLSRLLGLRTVIRR